MPTPRPITTETLAESIGIKSTSIRVRFCRTGHYFGLRPLKLPNGRLLWPADALERLANAPRGTARTGTPAREHTEADIEHAHDGRTADGLGWLDDDSTTTGQEVAA